MLPLTPSGFPDPHDLTAAAIVLGGTLVATVLRAGPRESRRTLRVLLALRRGGCDVEAMRARLAPQVQQFNIDGLVRARPLPSGDAEIDAVLAGLVAQRSVEAMQAAHVAGRDRRLSAAASAVRVLAQASELAPVAGLGATLVALAQLPASIAHGAAMGAIGMAVHATLMGLVLAHLVLVPLAAAAERQALALEAARGEIVGWLADQLAHAAPGGARARLATEPAPVPRGPVETNDAPASHRPKRGGQGAAVAVMPAADDALSQPVNVGAADAESIAVWPDSAIVAEGMATMPERRPAAAASDTAAIDIMLADDTSSDTTRSNAGAATLSAAAPPIDLPSIVAAPAGPAPMLDPAPPIPRDDRP